MSEQQLWDGLYRDLGFEGEADFAKQREQLQHEGHTLHCAIRILVGDGECECEKRGIVPGPISRAMMEKMEQELPGSTGIALKDRQP